MILLFLTALNILVETSNWASMIKVGGKKERRDGRWNSRERAKVNGSSETATSPHCTSHASHKDARHHGSKVGREVCVFRKQRGALQ